MVITMSFIGKMVLQNIIGFNCYLNGKLHREDGPAIVSMKDGIIFNKEWWYKGILISLDDNLSIEDYRKIIKLLVLL